MPLRSVFSLSVTGRKLNLPLRVLVSIVHIVSVMLIQLLFTGNRNRFSVRILVLCCGSHSNEYNETNNEGTERQEDQGGRLK